MSDQPTPEIITPVPKRSQRLEIEGEYFGVASFGEKKYAPLTLSDLRKLLDQATAQGCPDTAVIKGRLIEQTFIAVEW